MIFAAFGKGSQSGEVANISTVSAEAATSITDITELKSYVLGVTAAETGALHSEYTSLELAKTKEEVLSQTQTEYHADASEL
ncbi:MAG: hypothetical protein LBR54_00040 [Oscillospiraceae bacterium]|nr:hypothetical protein [Oscillospiraceae bacterium]